MKKKSLYILGTMILLMHNVVLPNGIVPAAIFIYPPMILLLPLIIFMEASSLANDLNMSKSEAWRLSLKANMISTLVGVPLLYIMGFLLTFFTPIPFGFLRNIFSLEPFHSVYFYIIFIVLTCLYFFLATWLVEYFVIKSVCGKKIQDSVLKKVVFYTNVKSYLLVISLSFLIFYVLTFIE